MNARGMWAVGANRLLGVRGCVLALVLAVGATSVLAAPEDDKAYRAGIGFANKGMNDLATTELKKYLEAQPEGALAPNARYTLAVCLVRLGRHAEAAPELDKVIAINGFEYGADARFLKAQCSAATGDDAAAISALKKLLRENPGFAQADRATELYAEALYRTGKYPQARAQLEEFQSKWPKSAVLDRADLFYALAASGAGDDARAIERSDGLLRRAPEGPYAANAALLGAQCRQRKGDLEGAAPLYETAAKSSDDNVKREALLGSVQVARARGKTAEAEALLGRLKSGSLAGNALPSATIEEGRIAYDQGKFEEALKVFAGLAGDSSSGVSDAGAYWAAKCEMKLGRNDAAADRFGEAAAKNPKSALLADMMFDRASALSRAGKNEEAARAFEEWRGRFAAHELVPEALAAEAACLYRMEKYRESLALCAEFVRQFPRHERLTAVELMVAENQFLAGEFGRAEASYAAWLDRHGEDSDAWRARVRRGLCLLKLDRADEGASVLGAALGAQDRNGEADAALRRAGMLAVGESCFARNDWAGAEKWFLAATPDVKGAPGEADIWLRLGLSIQRQGRFQEAVPAFARAANIAGSSSIGNHARFERGQALVELGKLDEARADFEAVIAGEATDEKKPLTGHALQQLASIASKQGKPEEAAELLGRSADSGGAGLFQQGNAWLAAGKYDKAEEAFTKLVKANPRDPKALEARVQRAIAINRQDRHEEAIAELTKLCKRADSMEAGLAASTRYEFGLALRAVGRDDDAAEAYRALLTGSPTPTLGAYGALDLAQIEVKQGKFDTAVATLDRCRESAASLKAAESSPVLEREMYVRGLCLLKLGKPGEAATVIAPFRERYPSSELSGSAALVLGDALLQTGRAAEATEELRRASQEGVPPDVASVALLKLGDACASAGQWTRSEEANAAFLARYPKSELWFQARFGQGFARENQGRQDAAIEAYRDVIARHEGPTAARAQFQIGECLYAQKKYEQAVGELLKVDVLYSSPDWTAAALYEAGRCLDESGRAADAAKQFEELAQRFPESKWAALAKERPKAISSADLPGHGSDTKTR